jgi:hypothetical protein
MLNESAIGHDRQHLPHDGLRHWLRRGASLRIRTILVLRPEAVYDESIMPLGSAFAGRCIAGMRSAKLRRPRESKQVVVKAAGSVVSRMRAMLGRRAAIETKRERKDLYGKMSAKHEGYGTARSRGGWATRDKHQRAIEGSRTVIPTKDFSQGNVIPTKDFSPRGGTCCFVRGGKLDQRLVRVRLVAFYSA